MVLKEKALASKLELLYNKGLYLVALNLAHSEQVIWFSLDMCLIVLIKWDRNRDTWKLVGKD